MYAQTKIQLFNQLRCGGYSNTELECILNTYELVIRLLTGRYRPSGKTSIAHAVGTASILSSLGVRPEVVAAGLLHAIYIHGDFGGRATGISDAKRKRVRCAVGKEVEEFVARYESLRWTDQTISAIHDGLHELGPIDRDVILVRLANELEDNLDWGILYCSNADARRRGTQRMGHTMVGIAAELGFPGLSAELRQAFKATALAEIPVELQGQNSQNGDFLIVPRSYRRLLSVALNQQLRRGLHFLRNHQLLRRLAGRLHRVRLSLGVGQKARS